MFLKTESGRSVLVSLPHGRGDVSTWKMRLHGVRESSPRAWGCFLVYLLSDGKADVFPTGVGMFPNPDLRLQRPECLPHGRGDVSSSSAMREAERVSSPRA